MGILEKIVETKRAEVARLLPEAAALRAAAESAPPSRPFEAALRRAGEVAVIAEIKRRSPSAGWIREELSVAEASSSYSAGGAAALSVLTDRDYFGGSLDALRTARSAVALPILRKDFIIDPVQLWEARAAGADAALLIVRILDDALLADLFGLARDLGLGILVEVHTGEELERALRAGATVVGINSRDLDTFRTDLGVALSLAGRVPADRVVVAESGIRGPGDVDRVGEAGADAVLVGESLMRQPDLVAATAALVGRRRLARGGTGESVAVSGQGRPRAKICGVCTPKDAALVSAAGADYIGVILAPGRGRSRTVEEAEAIYAAAPGCARVGVFVDPSPGEAAALAEHLALDVVQLHGSEPAATVAELRGAGWQVWKALRPRTGEEFLSGLERYARVADALLLDGWSAASPGGTGTPFPWDEIAKVRGELPAGIRLAVAGGLHPGNIMEICERLAPDIVDVSSGVERSFGMKDPELVRGFVAAARGVAGPERDRGRMAG